VSTLRQDLLPEPNTVVGHADGLTTAPPRLAVDDGTTHGGHPRDGGQFHQPLLLESALEAFRDAFAEP
jgi:hypothetical protein